MNVDKVCERIEVLVPYVFSNVSATNDPALFVRKVFEQSILLCCQW